MSAEQRYTDALNLLKNLIQTPSFSGEETGTAALIQQFLEEKGCSTERIHNNIIVKNKHFDAKKPTILLNSHHDTVKPNKAYTNDPFEAKIADGKLFGLGSNDAGGALVSLLSTFVHFYSREDLPYNLIIAATAEEENSGKNGVESVLPLLPEIDAAIVGEPTEMQMAVAEKGLLVIDAYASGIAGHAAHEHPKSAIYEAMDDILVLRELDFPKISETLGKVKLTVTQIDAGTQHNVVPDSCHFVIDVRINDRYSNRELFALIQEKIKSKLEARSFRLNSSSIPVEHPLVQAGLKLGKSTYGSPTLSDQALMSFPSLKMGPGVSARSHTADEFIRLEELKDGIEGYIDLLETCFGSLKK